MHTRLSWRIGLLLASLLLSSLPANAQTSEAKKEVKGVLKASFRAFANAYNQKLTAQPRLLTNLQDRRINESSGLAYSTYSRDVLWTHNDSGDDAFLFAIDRKGRTFARYKVLGAKNIDWEDIATGQGVNGKPALYILDGGDNNKRREDTTLYRVDEPLVDTSKTMQERTVPAFEAFPFRYPDRHHDCETILIHPKTGETLIVTKEEDGRSGVYAFPNPLHPNEKVTLKKVGEIVFSNVYLRGDTVFAKGERMATGGSVSFDGTRVIIRTYTRAFEWTVKPGQSLAEALKGESRVQRIPLTIQGESICYSPDGKSLFTTSERLPTPLYETPIK